MIWHLIRKDHRVFGRWLVLWAVLQLLGSWAAYAQWRGSIPLGVATGTIPLALILGTVLLALIVLQEPLHRGLDFWRTRPLRPVHLLLGKGFTIGLHFVVLPSLICLVFLLHTGHQDYLGLAGVEWLWKLLCWIIPVLTIAVFSDSIEHFMGTAVGVGIVFFPLFGVQYMIQEMIGWQEGSRLWPPFPSRNLLVALTVVVFGSFLTFRQYLFGDTRGTIKWLVLGTLVIQGIWWLPLGQKMVSREAPVPGSNAALDELVEDLDLRFSPLGEEYQGFSERDRREYLRVTRTPGLAVASRPYNLRVSVDETASRLETEQGTIVSSDPRPFWWEGTVEPRDCLASLGVMQPIERFHGWFGRLMEIPRPVVEELGEGTGTLHAEVVAMLRESEVVTRLPLTTGSWAQHGPHAITVHSTKRVIDVDDGDSEVHVVYSVHSPKRVWTEPWTEMTSRVAHNAWLVHRRLHIVVPQLNSKGTWSASAHPLMAHHRYTPRFGGPSHSETLSPVLWEEEFNPEEWDLVFVRKRVVASKRLPVTIPKFQLWRDIPKDPDVVLANLKAVTLPENASDAEVEAYLWELWRRWRGSFWTHVGETLEGKLRALESKHVPILLHAQERLLEGGFHNAKLYTLRVIKDLVTEDHQELILDHLDSTPRLLDIVQDKGWEDAALPRMIEIARTMPTVPYEWLDFFEQRQVRDPEVFLGMGNFESFDKRRFEYLRQIPEFPIEALTDRIFLSAIHEGHHAPPEGILAYLTLGRPNALEYVRLYLKGDSGMQSVDEETHADPMLNLLAKMSDCPPTREGASAWLEKHARTATFDQATGRYQIIR